MESLGWIGWIMGEAPEGSRNNKLPRIREVILCANKAKNVTIRTDGEAF